MLLPPSAPHRPTARPPPPPPPPRPPAPFPLLSCPNQAVKLLQDLLSTPNAIAIGQHACVRAVWDAYCDRLFPTPQVLGIDVGAGQGGSGSLLPSLLPADTVERSLATWRNLSTSLDKLSVKTCAGVAAKMALAGKDISGQPTALLLQTVDAMAANWQRASAQAAEYAKTWPALTVGFLAKAEAEVTVAVYSMAALSLNRSMLTSGQPQKRLEAGGGGGVAAASAAVAAKAAGAAAVEGLATTIFHKGLLSVQTTSLPGFASGIGEGIQRIEEQADSASGQIPIPSATTSGLAGLQRLPWAPRCTGLDGTTKWAGLACDQPLRAEALGQLERLTDALLAIKSEPVFRRQTHFAAPVRQRSSLLKAVITAFPFVSLPFLAAPLRSQRTVAIRSGTAWPPSPGRTRPSGQRPSRCTSKCSSCPAL
eukprot:SAG22_NODE_85_length_21510_cov_6.472187_10_plen_423_part_00